MSLKNNMDSKNIYSQMKPEKLLETLEKASQYGTQAEELNKQRRIILQNLFKIIQEKFPEETIDKRMKKDKSTMQVREMETQWKICAASMIKVKYTVKLPCFYMRTKESLSAAAPALYVVPTSSIGETLCITSKYGIKVFNYRSSYSPFSYIDIKNNAYRSKYFIFSSNKLYMRENNGILDFTILNSIPQLKIERVELFKQITQEIVWMIDSWRNFYRSLNTNKIDQIDNIINMSQYSLNEDVLRRVIVNLSILIKFNKQLISRTIKQETKWQPTIDKWKKYNKNFMVLKELSKGELKI